MAAAPRRLPKPFSSLALHLGIIIIVLTMLLLTQSCVHVHADSSTASSTASSSSSTSTSHRNHNSKKVPHKASVQYVVATSGAEHTPQTSGAEDTSRTSGAEQMSQTSGAEGTSQTASSNTSSTHAEISEEARERISKMTDEYEVVHVDMAQHLRAVEHASNRRRRRDATAQGQHDDQSSSEHVHHPPTSSFQIRAFGKTVTLDLKQNAELIPASFRYFTFNSAVDERPLITHGAVNCYYHGTVRGLEDIGHAQSTVHEHERQQQRTSAGVGGESSGAAVTSTYAVMSTCNGLSGSFGFDQYTGGEEEDPATASSSSSSSNNEQGKAYSGRYMIEPLVSQTTKPGTYPHAVFKEPAHKTSREDPLTEGGCATLHRRNESAAKNTGKPTTGEKRRWDFHDEDGGLAGSASAVKRGKRNGGTGGAREPPLYVEIAVVSDYSFTKPRGGLNITDTDKLVHEILITVSHADWYFQKINVRLVLATAFVFKAPIASLFLRKDPTGYNTLKPVEALDKNILQHLAHYDAVHLFTAELKGSVGTATLSSMCHKRWRAVGAVKLQYPTQGILPNVFVHEIGHNIGFEHVESTCRCDGEACKYNAIMKWHGGGEWSDCTKARLQSLRFQGRLNCLLNKPEAALSRPVCGNGVVERDEDCDCGPQEYCKDHCCDAGTCRFKPFAQCSAAHACCDGNCTLLKVGTVCRAAVEFCDLPDFCDGANVTCPRDDVRQSGLPCVAAEAPGTCHEGFCRSAERKCKAVVNATTFPSDDCNTLNTHGFHYGHCRMFEGEGTGVERYTFAACKPKDAGCGVLLCLYPTDNRTCHNRYVPPRLDGIDLYYVDDGSPCGPDLLCWNRSCVNASALRANLLQCPQANGAGCSGHGACTSENVCRCDLGRYGTNCEHSVKKPTIPNAVKKPTIPNAVTTPTKSEDTSTPVRGSAPHRVCTPGNGCRCNPGWSGARCEHFNVNNGPVSGAGGLSGGGVAGLVIGLLLGMLLCAAIATVVLKRKAGGDVAGIQSSLRRFSSHPFLSVSSYIQRASVTSDDVANQTAASNADLAGKAEPRQVTGPAELVIESLVNTANTVVHYCKRQFGLDQPPSQPQPAPAQPTRPAPARPNQSPPRPAQPPSRQPPPRPNHPPSRPNQPPSQHNQTPTEPEQSDLHHQAVQCPDLLVSPSPSILLISSPMGSVQIDIDDVAANC
ncbi:disintegrin and metalloproteinase domain-containing protein 23-like [Sycon ciliatum]|uniref:disintegrin and metalloproteinase domain-containing protein 23-like n=1 Tax=Sycon ciliatum TaxID=27933 RepID=UPI0031F664DA